MSSTNDDASSASSSNSNPNVIISHLGIGRPLTSEEESARSASQQAEEAAYLHQLQQDELERKQIHRQIISSHLSFSRHPNSITPNYDADADPYNASPAVSKENRKRVVFVDDRNHTLSQIAEAMVKKMHNSHMIAYSGGIESGNSGSSSSDNGESDSIDPLLLSILRDDYSIHLDHPRIKSLSSLLPSFPPSSPLNFIISLTSSSESSAREYIASNPKVKHIHQAFEEVAGGEGTSGGKEERCRKIVKEVHDFVKDLPELFSFL